MKPIDDENLKTINAFEEQMKSKSKGKINDKLPLIDHSKHIPSKRLSTLKGLNYKVLGRKKDESPKLTGRDSDEEMKDNFSSMPITHNGSFSNSNSIAKAFTVEELLDFNVKELTCEHDHKGEGFKVSKIAKTTKDGILVEEWEKVK